MILLIGFLLISVLLARGNVDRILIKSQYWRKYTSAVEILFNIKKLPFKTLGEKKESPLIKIS